MRLRRWVVRGGLVAAAIGVAQPALAQPAGPVVVTIKPIHSLVAAVMEGVAEPELLLNANASPHTYSLRPSDARMLAIASVVIWVGPGFENFLTDTLPTLAPDAASVALAEDPGLGLLPTREGGVWAEEEHEEGEGEEDHDHEHGAFDLHFWLDPTRAMVAVGEIVDALGAADPANAATYEANAARLVSELGALDAELMATLEPVRRVPFIVFHDGYQYLEAHYGLTGVGSVTLNPEIPIGAGRLSDLEAIVEERGARCAFGEPQFAAPVVETIADDTGIRFGTLDYLGVTVDAGPEAYAAILRANAASMLACLSG